MVSSQVFPWLQSSGEYLANSQLRRGEEGGRGEESLLNTVEPQNNGTLGPGILSFIERLSTLRRLKMY